MAAAEPRALELERPEPRRRLRQQAQLPEGPAPPQAVPVPHARRHRSQRLVPQLAVASGVTQVKPRRACSWGWKRRVWPRPRQLVWPEQDVKPIVESIADAADLGEPYQAQLVQSRSLSPAQPRARYAHAPAERDRQGGRSHHQEWADVQALAADSVQLSARWAGSEAFHVASRVRL